MTDELIFNQNLYALHEGVNTTNGSLLFDDLPVVEYANTITMDDFDISVDFGCKFMEVLNLWMFVTHKLNQTIEASKLGDPKIFYPISMKRLLYR